ncbi:hypothetical protein LZ554_001299 [Drepanopeziza brunnea f. sp. 'monogermtubi']|nr:hypothetical protein LZ554_001299 [Drepanopeziza brunnea f. sp. 'monogermtubi']
MTSHDVRDMLDLPGEAGPRPGKRQKVSAPRPVLKGLAREVQELGGDNPISIVPEIQSFKKKRFGSRKPAAKWDLRPFKNSARNGEQLVLRHWRRREDGSAEGIEDSAFAKFNVKVDTPQYTDEQYNEKLRSGDWTKDETDYLLALVQEYDLRWPVIWDRYDYQPPAPQPEASSADVSMVPLGRVRTMEDMKKRYYVVGATMMEINTTPPNMNTAEHELLILMKNFDPVKEANRKRFAETAFKRTNEEAKEEESLLLELKRILARTEKLSDERKELYHLLEAPPSTGNASAGTAIYSSSQGLGQLFQQLMAIDKSKKSRLKSIGESAGASPAPGPSGMNQQATFDRRESSVRESVSGPSGGGAPSNKKAPPQTQQPERRQLSPEEEAMYGVRRFDRITTSGPNFRSERIKKPIANKSTIQQTKIANVLAELGLTTTLFMPTAEVGEAFDSLLSGVNQLLEQKKLMDKLQGELNTALNVKAERERRERAARADMENAEGGGAEGAVKVEPDREKSAAPSLKGTSASTNQHKRSASVLSTASDKDSKRQRK